MKIDYSKNINSLTHKIIGCAMEVHKRLGNGLLINSGSQSLDFKRVYNKNLVNPVINPNPVQDKNGGGDE